MLACDLLTNGERRLRDAHFEDAIIRSYRVLELMGQYRLFMHGLDSGNLPPEHPAVQRLMKRLEKKKSTSFGMNKDGNYTAGREQVCRLLTELGDAYGKKLFEIGKKELNIRLRNLSLLNHGLTSTTPEHAAEVRSMLESLSTLLGEEGGPIIRRWIGISRSMDFSMEGAGAAGLEEHGQSDDGADA